MSDQFTACIHYGFGYVWKLFASQIHNVLICGRTFRNYLSVLLHILKNEYPFEGILRTGDRVIIRNNNELYFVIRIEGVGRKNYEIIDNKVTISPVLIEKDGKRKLEFYDAVTNGDIIGIFFNKEYDLLPVDGKTVIDIGASIGDSCIYFALRRSSRIIAIEPFPRSYEIAKKNIDVNGLTNKITLKLAGCAAKTGHIIVDPLYKGNRCSRLVGFKEGIKIPLLTIQDILNESNAPSGEAVLKMDCEGCEYDTILSCSTETLRFFSHILLEYHLGYKNLKEKLEKSGFQVSVTRPIMEHTTSIQGRTMAYRGYLYAIRYGT